MTTNLASPHLNHRLFLQYLSIALKPEGMLEGGSLYNKLVDKPMRTPQRELNPSIHW